MIECNKVVVLGGGESGVAAALLAKQKLKDVFVSDYNEIKKTFKNELNRYNIPFEEKGHEFERLKQADLIITSPGIPEHAKVIQDLRAVNKIIISEVEFASWYFDGKLISVTGSNGKTTTVSILFHVLNGLNENVALSGNIGTSFSRKVYEGFTDGIMILELSSFQLDNISTFKTDIGILLNITPDHLDRYNYEIENYALAKLKIFKNSDENSLAIINKEDQWSQKLKHTIPCKLLERSSIEIERFETNLKGLHNQFNISCVVAALDVLAYKRDQVLALIKTFKAVEHRLESVAFINGVEYVNDSKATNVDAVKYALDSVNKPVIWLAGGTDKGNDYRELFPIVKTKVNALICVGVDNSKLKVDFENIINDISECQDMDTAIGLAFEKADEGTMVLLSPACASFDLFNNYEHRGALFKEAVFKLLEKN